jgi:hypothetical protein
MMLLLASGLIGAQAVTAAAPPAAAQSLLQNCDAHKFETIVETKIDGIPRRSKLKLCGNEGQSDADWIKTLKDASDKAKANVQMQKGMRDQIVAAIEIEIARLNAAAGTTVSGAMPAPRQTIKPIASSDYAPLPPLPTAPTAPTKVLATGPDGNPVFLPQPKLSFSCFNPNDIVGDGPCTGFERETMLTVLAGENLPAGTSIRFVRDGDAKADVQLAQLQRGKSMRFSLPSDVCSHSGGGTLEIRIVRSTKETGPSGQVVGKDGPYNLRC